MTSRSIESGQTGQVEKIGLPGQPEGTSNGESDPEAKLNVAQLRAHADELGFSPQDQVRWLAPAQLLRTAVQVGLAFAYSTFTDKRELQRNFPADPLALAPDLDGGCWIDFMADTGDGFDSTYTVAALLAAEQLMVTGPDGERQRLPRGRLLVLGGDEVYPTASSERYEDRLKGPLRTALHAQDVQSAVDGADAGEPPLLLALPGNHDWYDGLTAFLRVFGQRRRIGGWQTVQGRSYFVMQLPGGWWLAGLDSQLGSELDDPQLDFFRTQLTERLQPGDGVILCCASPAWVRTPHDARAFDSYHYFERTVVTEATDPVTGRSRPTGAQVRLWLTGDQHHYARYQEVAEQELSVGPDRPEPADGGGRQLITCGLGGAYLAATHHLPEDLTLPPAGSTERHHGEPANYRLATRWPSEAESRRLVRGLLAPNSRGLPFRNPGFWRLAIGVHAMLFLMLISLLGVIRQQGPIDAVRAADQPQVWRLGGQLALWWAVALVISMIVLSVRARRVRGPARIIPAIGLQILVAVVALAAAVWVVRVVNLPTWFPGGRALPNYLLLAVLLAVIAPVAGLVGSYAVALTLTLSRSRLVADWQFSAQSIDDRKGFLRLRIDSNGRLVVYPVAVEKVVRRWRIGAGSPSDKPPRRVIPVDGLPIAQLIEEPVVILRSPMATHG
jgi:hypothetical protein